MPNHNQNYASDDHGYQDPDYGTHGEAHDRENPWLEVASRKSGRRDRLANRGRDRQRGENRRD